MIYRLLYVSRSLLPDDDTADEVVAGIVEVSTMHNAQAGITGALVFTGDAFAQVLEGEMGSVLRLMADIAGDPRHSDIEIVEQGHVSARTFGAWSMGYWGRSIFVSRLIRDITSKSAGASVARRGSLLRFMTEWTRRQPASRLRAATGAGGPYTTAGRNPSAQAIRG